MSLAFPLTRFRRLRASPALRDLVQETTVTLNDLIYPIFVEEELDDFAPVESMPGVFRIPERKLAATVKEIAAAGVRALMLFGVSHHKDADGSDSWNPNGLLARMIKRCKDAAPGLVVISDTCFCEYTSHGHCGVIAHGEVHNDHTIENLGRQAVVAAKAGADMIAPSAMMDGQVTAIRACARRQRFSGHADHGVFVEIRLGLLWAVSRRRWLRPAGRPQGLPDEPVQWPRGVARIAVG